MGRRQSGIKPSIFAGPRFCGHKFVPPAAFRLGLRVPFRSFELNSRFAVPKVDKLDAGDFLMPEHQPVVDASIAWTFAVDRAPDDIDRGAVPIRERQI